MITLCTVIADNNIDCLRHLLASLCNNTSNITQVLVADANINGKAKNLTSTIYGIKYRQIKFTPNNCMGGEDCIEPAFMHALGLHLCIDESKTEYLMFVDSDVIFYQDVGKLFHKLYEKHDLGFIGIEHTQGTRRQCYDNFPTVITALVKKSKLPPHDFLKGSLRYRTYLFAFEENNVVYPTANGKYLLQSPIKEIVEYFPNQDALFDVGCNLWYWFKDSKWISFTKIRIGPTIYTTAHNNNFGLKQFKKTSNLLYHCSSHANRLDFLERVSGKVVLL